MEKGRQSDLRTRCGREGEKERDRDRETERDREIETEKQKNRDRDRKTETERQRQRFPFPFCEYFRIRFRSLGGLAAFRLVRPLKWRPHVF